MAGDPFEIEMAVFVAAPAEKVFDLLADFAGQDAWLRRRFIFRGTAEISDDPIAVGTTYFEPSPLGFRRGEVLELDRPRCLAFHQPFTLRFGFGTVDVVGRYELTPEGDGTRVTRRVELTFPARLRPMRPVMVPRFRGEGSRVLKALEEHCAAPQAS